METKPAFYDEDFKNRLSLSQLWTTFKAAEGLDSLTEETWIQKIALLDEMSAQNNTAIFLYNSFTRRFIFMSDRMNIFGGYAPSLYTAENGAAFSLSKFRPDHLNAAFNSPKILVKYCKNHEILPTDNVILSMDFLYRNKFDVYFKFLQQCLVVQNDSNGYPLLILSFGHNISHIKKADCFNIAITSPKGNEFYNYNNDEKCFEMVKPFSEQEKKILRLLAHNMDSKAIADKLFISPHTVDTHRRNLINKTNCLDTTGVVAYARMINLI